MPNAKPHGSNCLLITKPTRLRGSQVDISCYGNRPPALRDAAVKLQSLHPCHFDSVDLPTHGIQAGKRCMPAWAIRHCRPERRFSHRSWRVYPKAFMHPFTQLTAMRNRPLFLTIHLLLATLLPAGPVFTIDADLQLNGPPPPIAIREDMMVVGEPGFEITPQVSYASIFADLGSTLGMSDGKADAAAAIASSLRIIAELGDGLQDVGAAHTFRRDGWGDRWTFSDTFNNWDAAVRAVGQIPRFLDHEYGRFGAAVAFAGDWVVTGSPSVRTSPTLTVLGGQDLWHEVGAVTFTRPGWQRGFELTGHAIADTGSWLNLGSLVAGGDGFAAAASGPKRTSLSATTSSGVPGVLHLFKPLAGAHPWALARTFDYRNGSWQDYGGGSYPEIRRLSNAGPDLLMVLSAGDNSEVSVLKDVAAHLAAGTVPPKVRLLETPEAGARVGVASDGNTLVIGVPSLNQILVFRRNGSGTWIASQTLHGAPGEQIGSTVGVGGNAVVSCTMPGGSVIAAWRELADGNFSRYASQDAGRTLSSLSFHPESMALIGPAAGRTLVQSANLTRSFRVNVKDSAGNPLPASTFRILQVNTARFSDDGTRLTTHIRRHLGPPRKIWVDMTYSAAAGTLAGQAGKTFYYDLMGPDQNRNAPLAEQWFPSYRATHVFEGQASSSFLFEADGSRVPDWSEGNRPNGYLINPRLYDARSTPVPAQWLVTDGPWNLNWSFSPGNDARVKSATLCIETELSPYVGEGYMRGGQTVTTDAQGGVLVEGMDKGSYLLEMTGAYSGRSRVIDLQDFIHDDGVEITASGRGVIRGSLTADTLGGTGYGFALSNPVAGVALTVAGRQVVTDASGNFSVTGLAPGTYSVVVPAAHVINGGNTRSVTLSDSNPETTLWLRENAAGSHSLTLRDGSGNALSGVEVVINGPYGYRRTLASAAGGGIYLGALLSGSYEVRVQDNILPWGAAPFTLTVAGATTQLTLQPRGQSRVVDFGHAMAGKTARFIVTPATRDTVLTSEWTYTEPTDHVLKFRTYTTLQKTFRLPVTITFDGPCEILSAEAGVSIDMKPPTSNQMYPLLEAKPKVGLEDPYRTIHTPASRTWSRVNTYNGYDLFDRAVITAPIGRQVPAATTETWNLVLDFAEPEVPWYVYRRIKTNSLLSIPDTYMKLTLRSPDGVIRQFSSPIGADGRVTVSDLPATGRLHARVDAPALVPGSESGLFDITDSSEWILAPAEFGAVQGVCRLADGSGAARVTVSLLDAAGEPFATGETGLEGSFRTERVPTGTYRIRASRSGYQFSPAERSITVTTSTATADFAAQGAVTLPLQLVDADGRPDPTVGLVLESAEWRQELAAPVQRALNPNLTADAFLQAAVTVDEEFDLGKLRLYFEGAIRNSEPWEAALALAHPDGTRLLVQENRLDYYAFWRLYANAWHEDAAPIPPVGFGGSNRWSASFPYGQPYSQRSMRPLDLFANLSGRTSKGTWFIGLGPAVYDSNQTIDTRIQRVILAMSPRTPLQPQTSVASSGTAAFQGLAPGPYSLAGREGSVLPRGLSLMLRGGASAGLCLRTAPAGTIGAWPLTGITGTPVAIQSPVSSATATTYRWLRNGVEIATTDVASLVLASASPADEGLYEVEASNQAWRVRAEVGNLSVRLDPGFTWVPPDFIVQGADASLYQNAMSLVPGEITYDVTELSSLEAGLHQVTATFTPADGAYATVSITRNIRVKRPVVLSWQPPSALAVDAPDSVWKTATSSVPGAFSYTPGSISNLAGQSLEISVIFTPEDGDTYTAASLARTITLRPSAVLTWNPPSQVARWGNRTAIRCASANIPGSFSYAPEDLENAGYGEHRVTLTFTPEDTSTYEVQTREVAISVARFLSNESLLRGVIRGGAAWADVNNDLRLDLLLSGEAKPDAAGATWYATASYTGLALGSPHGLQAGTRVDLPAARYGITRWHDADGDGLLDLFHGGHKQDLPSWGGDRFLFRNTGTLFLNTADFFASGDNSSPLSYATDARWGDYDHDGDADLVIQCNGETAVYRNDAASFTRVLSWPIVNGRVAWQDLDGDADLDLILCGNPKGGWQSVTKVLLNDGHGALTETSCPFAQLSNGDMDFEDIDGDGDLDAIISSYWQGTHLYRNLGGGSFLEIPNALPSYQSGSVAFGDLDGDGDPDLLMNGTDGNWNFITRAFLNDGAGSFSLLDEPLRGLYSGGIALADYDSDGDLDWVMHGGYFNDLETDTQLRETTVLVTNVFASPNARPTAPSNVTVQADGTGRIRFSWPAGTDSLTPASSLRYNLAVTRADGTHVLPPLSRHVDGSRLVPDRGNTGLNRSWVLNLPDGTYRASVQTIDTGLAASVFSPTITFTVPLAASPYDSFLTAHPELTGENAAPLADPDGDGLPNLLEAFLGGSSPTSAGHAGKPAVDSAGTPALVMVIPDGVNFGPGPRPTAVWSGYEIAIEGAVNPSQFTAPVETVQTSRMDDSPPVPQGFKRVAFRIPGMPPQGFFRMALSPGP